MKSNKNYIKLLQLLGGITTCVCINACHTKPKTEDNAEAKKIFEKQISTSEFFKEDSDFTAEKFKAKYEDCFYNIISDSSEFKNWNEKLGVQTDVDTFDQLPEDEQKNFVDNFIKFCCGHNSKSSDTADQVSVEKLKEYAEQNNSFLSNSDSINETEEKAKDKNPKTKDKNEEEEKNDEEEENDEEKTNEEEEENDGEEEESAEKEDSSEIKSVVEDGTGEKDKKSKTEDKKDEEKDKDAENPDPKVAEIDKYKKIVKNFNDNTKLSEVFESSNNFDNQHHLILKITYNKFVDLNILYNLFAKINKFKNDCFDTSNIRLKSVCDYFKNKTLKLKNMDCDNLHGNYYILLETTDDYNKNSYINLFNILFLQNLNVENVNNKFFINNFYDLNGEVFKLDTNNGYFVFEEKIEKVIVNKNQKNVNFKGICEYLNDKFC